ncbi:hypothetical protein F5883DRAFT_619228 [Diaporthe sp. PMI_573]|nr:hypothetical protein F5883DRAFT_619228 [Diaporthaceae sp. PMI_573]
MMLSHALLALSWACESLAAKAYPFKADNHETWKNTRIPSLVDLSEDQNSGSYFTAAFVTTTTRRQFVLIHHQFMNVCKSSLLDLETMEYRKNVFECEINNSTKTVTPDSVALHFPDFSFATNASDKVSELELFAQAEDYSLELNVHARTSKVLLNGGNGAVAWGPGYKRSTHWSIPAAQTSGTLDIGEGERLALIPSESLTWYDHQIIDGLPSSFTWFTVHFPTTEIQVSIWAYEWPESGDVWRYATVRLGEETTMVLPYTLEAD